MQIHVVQPNETFTDIAEQYGLSVSFLQNYNRLPNPEQLVVGQTIVIVRPQSVYTVQDGDTLETVSKQTGLTTLELLQNNPQTILRSELFPGETLVLTFKEQQSRPIDTNGYAYPFIDEAVLRNALPYLTFLTIFGYGFDFDGNLIYPDDEFLLALAREYQTAPMLLLSSITAGGGFSSELVSALMEDPQLQETVLNNIFIVMQEKGYVGLDIDFEYIPPENSQGYLDFVNRAVALLNPLGYIVHVDLAPKTSATQAGLLYEAHNYETLGNAANQVLVMTYEWGFTYGPPMAVAPLNQVRRVLEYAITEIPPEKIQMGIPNYAYDWQLPFERGRAATTIGNVRAIEIALQYGAEILYDPLAQTPYFYYTASDCFAHVVWFEDTRSINAKLDLLTELQLSGAGYWNLMRPFPQNWTVLNQKFSITKRPPL